MTPIEEAKAFFAIKAKIQRGQRSLSEHYGAVILSALTEAEQERDSLKISCSAKDKDIDYAEARVKELEAELARKPLQ